MESLLSLCEPLIRFDLLRNYSSYPSLAMTDGITSHDITYLLMVFPINIRLLKAHSEALLKINTHFPLFICLLAVSFTQKSVAFSKLFCVIERKCLKGFKRHRIELQNIFPNIQNPRLPAFPYFQWLIFY